MVKNSVKTITSPQIYEVFDYVLKNGITDKQNSAHTIWQVGKGDGTYLGV
jgi:hypothetical protein